jgi:arylsulfatase A-like enzyme
MKANFRRAKPVLRAKNSGCRPRRCRQNQVLPAQSGDEKDCIERVGLSRIQVHMKLIRFDRFCGALVLLGVLLNFSARAELSFIYTNNMPKPDLRRANIVFIECDGLGYGDLSCYGQTKFQTPNLDKLAAGGIRFTNYSLVSPIRSVSLAALMLGKDAAHLEQSVDTNAPLSANDVTVAQLLKNSGYHTGLIGEWQLGDENTLGAPWEKGFDEFTGYFKPSNAENYYADFWFRHDPFSHFQGRARLYANAGGKEGLYIPDLFTKAAINYMRVNCPDRFNRYRPFFLLLNYATPRPNLAMAKRTGNGMEVPTDAPYSDESWPQPEKNRAAMIARMDNDIGKLVGKLKSLNIESNTVIFFSSMAPPQKAGGVDPEFFHSMISTNDLRVPMIVSCPGKIPAGRVSGLRWTAADFLPTAAAIARLNEPADIDGVSVLPTLFGETQTNLPAIK